MWLEVGETEDSMVDAMYVAGGRNNRIVWWVQCVRSKGVAGGRVDRGLHGGGNV